MNYENRVTAYIDILGFKDILANTVGKKDEDNPEKINEIFSAYKAIRDVWDLDEKETTFRKSIPRNSKQITTFSDCVVISFQANEKSEIFYTLLEIKWMIMRLIYRGILCRGAITYGKLIHTDQVLFGPALAEAYILESKAALYPRVILHRDIIELAGQFRSSHHTSEEEQEYVEGLLEKDSDGMYYVDYFAKAQSELDDPQYGFPDYIDKIGNTIRKGLMSTSRNIYKSDIKVKYRWMKERYNNLIENVQNKKFIKLLKDNGEFELAETYMSFKKINPSA
ncbi:hypothetical protein EO244_16540 [Ancylomarina salipaludis]|uniref:Uncharacterized protein n=1 Tax=Ancylomarina salipaludis TaxID=2501299 RepID=A0A4Q1JHY8_9BACT|nr:hypothetical protein [Ancylomarina salipaludis]RXQ87286.1 hypothetical protein EO244_16540 [Ancylomarina salipaludis]